VEANAAFVRTAGIVMLNTEAFENADRAVVHADRDAEVILAHWPAQDFSHLRVQVSSSATWSNWRWAISKALVVAAIGSPVVQTEKGLRVGLKKQYAGTSVSARFSRNRMSSRLSIGCSSRHYGDGSIARCERKPGFVSFKLNKIKKLRQDDEVRLLLMMN
jgi:hypothetical protein